MNEVYSTSFLNTTLARWIQPPALRTPQLDCASCARPAKCCAFQPFVPNFLLGAWLAAAAELPEIPHVRFHPAGAVATLEYRAAHASVSEPGVDLLCGFFDREKRTCRLWAYRPGECSNYFCDDLRLSEARQNLRQRTFDVEMAVTQMALVELGFSGRQIGEQIDIVNGVGEGSIYPGHELLMMYKRAWIWSQNLNPQTVQSWLEPA